MKEPRIGLKQRFLKVLEKRPDVATDFLKGRFLMTKDGVSRLDIAAAERAAGIETNACGETAKLEKRLAEEAPDYLTRFHSGEFSSIRKAAIAAGIHQDSHLPLMRLKANWRKANANERRQFRQWLKS